MNIGHLNIEEQPTIDFQMKNTFHFFLGYGRFLGHADYFMRMYNEAINPIKQQKGEQLVCVHTRTHVRAQALTHARSTHACVRARTLTDTRIYISC